MFWILALKSEFLQCFEFSRLKVKFCNVLNFCAEIWTLFQNWIFALNLKSYIIFIIFASNRVLTLFWIFAPNSNFRCGRSRCRHQRYRIGFRSLSGFGDPIARRSILGHFVFCDAFHPRTGFAICDRGNDFDRSFGFPTQIEEMENLFGWSYL